MDSNSIQARTLWIGEIENWMDEQFIESRLLTYNIPIKSIKIIRDRSKGISLGYGFIEFYSKEQANQVLNEYNNKGILHNNKTFKLNWASDSASKAACMGSLPKNEFTIYIGELDSNVTENYLKGIFLKLYKSVIGAKIVIDPITKKSKGYGFVRFNDQNESQRAIIEMNGFEIAGKPIKVNQAAFKKLQELGFNHNNFGEDLSKFNNNFEELNLNNGNYGNKEECENDILNNFYKCDGNFLGQFNNYISNDKPNNLFEFYMNQSQNFNYVNPFNYYSRPNFNHKNQNKE